MPKSERVLKGPLVRKACRKTKSLASLVVAEAVAVMRRLRWAGIAGVG